MFIDEAKIAVQLHAREHRPDLRPRQGRRQLTSSRSSTSTARTCARSSTAARQRGEAMPIAHGLLRHHEGLRGARLRAQQARRGRAASCTSCTATSRRRTCSSAYEGEVKLIDFGIAKAAGKASKTQAGILKGKFGYMSPEQVRGLPIDRRSDIFARRHRALRAAHRRAAVRRRERLLDAREGAQRRDPAAVHLQPEDPRRARAHRAQGARARTPRIATRTRSTCTTSCRRSSTPPASSTRARISRRG